MLNADKLPKHVTICACGKRMYKGKEKCFRCRQVDELKKTGWKPQGRYNTERKFPTPEEVGRK